MYALACILFLKIYDFDRAVSGLRQKVSHGLLGILGNSWEGPGIVGKALGLLENIPWTFGWVECGRFRTAPKRPFYPLLAFVPTACRKQVRPQLGVRTNCVSQASCCSGRRKSQGLHHIRVQPCDHTFSVLACCSGRRKSQGGATLDVVPCFIRRAGFIRRA